ncbi:MAG: NAD(P)H-dependent oxidoreductase [Bacteroidota bacterium]
MENYMDALNWRYAVKKFDPSKKVSDHDFDILMEAARLSASSYGLQPYKVLVINDKKMRERLKAVSWGQSQITDASHLIVIANQTDFGDELVDDYLRNAAITREITEESLKDYGAMMKSSLTPLSPDQKAKWTGKQAYIVLGNLLSAAASLGIDSCPMEGFDAKKYNEILGLDDKSLNAAVVMTIGYRSEEDKTQHYKKVRKTKGDLIVHI